MSVRITMKFGATHDDIIGSNVAIDDRYGLRTNSSWDFLKRYPATRGTDEETQRKGKLLIFRRKIPAQSLRLRSPWPSRVSFPKKEEAVAG